MKLPKIIILSMIQLSNESETLQLTFTLTPLFASKRLLTWGLYCKTFYGSNRNKLECLSLSVTSDLDPML